MGLFGKKATGEGVESAFAEAQREKAEQDAQEAADYKKAKEATRTSKPEVKSPQKKVDKKAEATAAAEAAAEAARTKEKEEVRAFPCSHTEAHCRLLLRPPNARACRPCSVAVLPRCAHPKRCLAVHIPQEHRYNCS